MHCNEALNVLALHVDTTSVNNKEVYESFTTENIGESEKERVLRIIKERDAEKAKKAAASKKVPFKVKKPTATEPLPAPLAPLKKSKKKQSPKRSNRHQRSNQLRQLLLRTKVTCDDKKTKRSKLKQKIQILKEKTQP